MDPVKWNLWNPLSSPLTCLILAKLALQAGFGPGIFYQHNVAHVWAIIVIVGTRIYNYYTYLMCVEGSFASCRQSRSGRE